MLKPAGVLQLKDTAHVATTKWIHESHYLKLAYLSYKFLDSRTQFYEVKCLWWFGTMQLKLFIFAELWKS